MATFALVLKALKESHKLLFESLYWLKGMAWLSTYGRGMASADTQVIEGIHWHTCFLNGHSHANSLVDLRYHNPLLPTQTTSNSRI